MRLRRIISFTSLTMAAVVVFPDIGQSDEPLGPNYWRITAAAFECLVENIEYYKNASENPVIIAPSLCPHPTSILKERGFEPCIGRFCGPDIGNAGDEPMDKGGNPIVFYTRHELNCLSESARDADDGFVFVPKEVICE